MSKLTVEITLFLSVVVLTLLLHGMYVTERCETHDNVFIPYANVWLSCEPVVFDNGEGK